MRFWNRLPNLKKNHFVLENKSERIVLYIFLLLLVSLYLYGHNHYMVEHVDDAWTLSWAKTWWDTGNVYDSTFGLITGDGGTSLFSRTYVFVYGLILNLAGWTRGGAFIISTILIVASACLWKGILREAGYSQGTVFWFPLLMLFLEAYFAAGHKTRVDALAFFMATLSFWLFTKEKFLFSGFAALIAGETAPYGLTAFMYIFSFLFLLWPKMTDRPLYYLQKALWFVVGAVLGLGYYLLLHYPWLRSFADLGGRINGNVFISYFFGQRYSWRHLPELAMWIVALFLFAWKRGWRKDRFLLPFLILACSTSLLLPRGNFHYIIYLYPPFLLLILEEAGYFKLRVWLVTGLILLMIPQYGWLFWTQRHYNHKQYIRELGDHIPTSPEFVYGHANAWFALNGSNFHGPGYFAQAELPPEEWPEEFIVVENNSLKRTGGWDDLNRGKELYEKKVINKWLYYDGTPVRIWLFTRRKDRK